MDLILFSLGGLGFIVFLVMLVLSIIKKRAKKNSLIGLVVCFILFITGLTMPSSQPKTDLEVNQGINTTGADINTGKVKVELTDTEKNLLGKAYVDFSEAERADFASILEKFSKLDKDAQDRYQADVDRLKTEKEEWVKEQDRIAKEKEEKEWQEFVEKNTKTLSAGEHFVGEQIEKGVYDVTFPKGSGNFMAYSSDGDLLINEIGGSNGISKYRAILPDEAKIELSGISAVFTPAKRTVIPYQGLELYAGYWVVGQDLSSGRYKATSTGGDSGNFMVYSSNGSLRTNEILGGDFGVDEVIVNLKDGDLIQISSLSKVNFAPEK